MKADPILDILRERVCSRDTFHASRAEVEHLIEKVDRLLLHNEALSETVALQKILADTRKGNSRPAGGDFPVTGEP